MVSSFVRNFYRLLTFPFLTLDFSYRTRQEKSQHSFIRTNLEFSHHDLNELKELHPPPLMPNGNVGTPLLVFMELIRTCKLPPHVIKKLDLNFAAGQSKKKYSNVPLDYKSLEKDRTSAARGPKRKLVPCTVKDCMQGGSKENDPSSSACSLEMLEFQTSEQCNSENGSDCEELDKIEADHDSDVEEWDRHESLHNDVTSQERTKERLFEEDIELKWEKGGSGLVFYTDAAFWKEQEEPTFDEETADDWDVDMEIYENPGACTNINLLLIINYMKCNFDTWPTSKEFLIDSFLTDTRKLACKCRHIFSCCLSQPKKSAETSDNHKDCVHRLPESMLNIYTKYYIIQFFLDGK